jgi:hypothetical protein
MLYHGIVFLIKIMIIANTFFVLLFILSSSIYNQLNLYLSLTCHHLFVDKYVFHSQKNGMIDFVLFASVSVAVIVKIG